jgi:hypothetical protein
LVFLAAGLLAFLVGLRFSDLPVAVGACFLATAAGSALGAIGWTGTGAASVFFSSFLAALRGCERFELSR